MRHTRSYTTCAPIRRSRRICIARIRRARWRCAAICGNCWSRIAPETAGFAGQCFAANTRAAGIARVFIGRRCARLTVAPSPDPKDRLAEYRLYESAQAALYDRRLERAAAILRQILVRDPQNTLARRDLGGTYVEQHQYAKARACFEQVMAAAPDDYMAQFELGIADKHLGLAEQALSHLQAACKIAPEAEQCRRELRLIEKK